MNERLNGFSVNNYEVEGAIRYYFNDHNARNIIYNAMNNGVTIGWYVGVAFFLHSVLVDPYYQNEFEKLLKELDVVPSHVE